MHDPALIKQAQWPIPPRWRWPWWHWRLICDDSLCQQWRISCDQYLHADDLYQYALMQTNKQLGPSADSHLIDIINLSPKHSDITVAWLVVCPKKALSWFYPDLKKRYGQPRAIYLNSHIQCLRAIGILKLNQAILIHIKNGHYTACLVKQGRIADVLPPAINPSIAVIAKQCEQWQQQNTIDPCWLLSERNNDNHLCQQWLQKHAHFQWWQLLPKYYEQ